MSLLTLIALARAATFTLDDPGDDPDLDLTDGLCVTATGRCTLRAAVEQAGSLSGPDTIVLPAGSIDVSGTFSLTAQGDLTVRGAGAGLTTLRLLATPLFHAVDCDLAVEQLTLDGSASAGAPLLEGHYSRVTGGSGAVLRTQTAITLRDAHVLGAGGPILSVVDDHALDYEGTVRGTLTRVVSEGGAGDVLQVRGDYGSPGVGTASDLTVIGHRGGDLADARYASITVDGFLVADSTLSVTARAEDGLVELLHGTLRDVTATHLLGEARGPSTDAARIVLDRVRVRDSVSTSCGLITDDWGSSAIRNSQIVRSRSGSSFVCGSTSITGSLFAYNDAVGDGGVVAVWGWYPYGLWISDTFMIGNRTTGSGGAIWTRHDRGTTRLAMNHLTLVGNVADSDGDGVGTGGNLYARGATLTASVLAGGRTRGRPDDLDAADLTSRDNVVGADATPGGAVLDAGSLVGTPAAPLDPLLGRPRRLQNGQWGMVPLPGSPLIDATDVDGTDLAGEVRPVDGDGDGVARSDVGAVEAPAP